MNQEKPIQPQESNPLIDVSTIATTLEARVDGQKLKRWLLQLISNHQQAESSNLEHSSQEVLAEFYERYPTPVAAFKAMNALAYEIGPSRDQGLLATLAARSELEALGLLLYTHAWESQVVAPRRLRRQNSYPLSKYFLSQSMITGRVPDGFVDPGRGSRLSRHDEEGVSITNSGRETLVVDRVEDIGYQRISELILQRQGY